MATPKNERKTENIVRDDLRLHGYYLDQDLIVEEQKSDTPRIQKLLETASKNGEGVGKPEFLIRSKDRPDFIIVIECKADPKKHISPTLDKYAEYAVDGVLLYASYLAKDFDVLAIAVSGETRSALRFSHYIHLKGEAKAVEFDKSRGVVPFEDYYQAYAHSDVKFRQDYHVLLGFSRTLNNLLHARKVIEADRALLISGILIALQNEAFRQSYKAHKSAKQLAANLQATIRNEFESADLPQERLEDLQQAYSFIPPRTRAGAG